MLFIFKNENFLAPAGLCSISRAVLESGAESYLCEMNRDDVFVKIKEIKPDLIAYSASTGEAKHYLNINSRIKSYFPKIFTIMGGPHATFFPDVVKEGSLDAICVGEGEGAMFDLLSALSKGKDITKIPNILTADNRDKFSIRNLIEDLDSLPFPDYAILYDNTPMGRYPLKSIVASRGCPYDCSYCFNPTWRKIYRNKGPIVRRHSVDYITDEISYVKNRWPLSFVKFYDDVFTYKADGWLEEFSKKYRERVGLPFFVLTREI
ncbi:MAG: cobalamin-dependent protein, partial [Candidatus Omnitrophica bacterium]|nr:cobalamin-dependent protein [Candidatus Omnitrophota bacterium]